MHIIMSFALAVTFGPAVFAAPSASRISANVDRAAQEASAGEARAQKEGVQSFSTTWKRCDIYEHHRRLRVGGKRGKVRVEHNCQEVVTHCGAVISNDKAYVSQSCYYATKDKDQKLYFQSASLKYFNGQTVYFSVQSAVKSRDFVVFALK